MSPRQHVLALLAALCLAATRTAGAGDGRLCRSLKFGVTFELPRVGPKLEFDLGLALPDTVKYTLENYNVSRALVQGGIVEDGAEMVLAQTVFCQATRGEQAAASAALARLLRNRLDKVFPKPRFGRAHLEYLTTSTAVVLPSGAPPTATAALIPALYFTVSVLNATPAIITPSFLRAYAAALEAALPGCKVMVEVTFEHQGAASVQLNGRAFVPQVQLNTRVTRGSEGQYARLAAIIKGRAALLWKALGVKGLAAEETSVTLGYLLPSDATLNSTISTTLPPLPPPMPPARPPPPSKRPPPARRPPAVPPRG